MAQGYKNPSVLQSDRIWEDWKNELEIWRKFTEDVLKEKQALAVTLSSVSGEAKTISLEILVDTLNEEGGLVKIRNFLSFFDLIRFCRYLSEVDRRTENATNKNTIVIFNFY